MGQPMRDIRRAYAPTASYIFPPLSSLSTSSIPQSPSRLPSIIYHILIYHYLHTSTQSILARHITMSAQPSTGAAAASHKYDQNFTQNVIDTCGPKTSPRFKEIFASAVRHLHDFTREVDLTPEEWLEGVTFFNEVGKMWAESNGKRNEMHRMCDLVGLES
jgi:hypothetical protein